MIAKIIVMTITQVGKETLIAAARFRSIVD
jgi:hypothetical protein